MASIRYCIILALFGNILLTAAARDPLLDTIFVRFFKRDGSYTDIKEQNASLIVPELNTNELLVFFIHGYTEWIDREDVQLLRSVYLQHTNVNYLAADYRSYSLQLYPISVEYHTAVGQVLANILDSLVQNGVNPAKVHVIGHSLGAHVAGVLGRTVGFKVPRITGLDPAGPLFYVAEPHLSTSDADFVDIIHTDMGVYGQAEQVGHVDFYPNFGHRQQPGCLIDVTGLCSHQRSFVFYGESVRNKDAFLGVKCQDSIAFVAGTCDKSDIVPMGYATPSTARGKYYLTTNANSPYGRGLAGTSL